MSIFKNSLPILVNHTLLSVGSGEAAWFWTGTLGVEFAVPNLAGKLELYDGFVFNLWNARDYNGPFESLSLGLDMKLNGGFSLFWDAKRAFAGPWGGAIPFLSAEVGLHKQPFSMTKSNIYYMLYGNPLPLPRSSVVTTIYSILFATKLIEAINEGGNPSPFSWLLFETSIWTHVGLAHHYWNMKEPKYSMEIRRTKDRKFVPEFKSGPSVWRLPL